MYIKNNRDKIESARSINRMRILRLLFEKGGLARFEIANTVGLTQASVTRIINDCIKAGIVIEQKSLVDSQARGRRPIPLSLNSDTYFVIGIHIGAFWIDICLMNLLGEVVYTLREDRSHSFEKAFHFMTSTIQNIKKTTNGHILAIGITLYGKVNHETEEFSDYNELGWGDFAIRSSIEKELEIPIYIDTNIYSMAIAEYIHNPLPLDNALLFLNVSTTVGMAIAVNNVVIRGKHGLAGMLEHTPWLTSGPTCQICEAVCISSLLSDKSILAQVHTVYSSKVIPDIHALISKSKSDPYLRKILKDRADKVGQFVASLAAFHDPSRIVLTGSCLFDDGLQISWVRKSYDKYLHTLNRNVAKIEVPFSNKDIPFTVIGAGTIALQKVFSTSLELVSSNDEEIVAQLPLT
ncbi:ROK family transcriptional regulator [bacterium LRH843]|nr:ROK family transcriptional regulator [bacterium LRH843]